MSGLDGVDQVTLSTPARPGHPARSVTMTAARLAAVRSVLDRLKEDWDLAEDE
jgi:hypothetical protein